jgi:hypothetical protein
LGKAKAAAVSVGIQPCFVIICIFFLEEINNRPEARPYSAVFASVTGKA